MSYFFRIANGKPGEIARKSGTTAFTVYSVIAQYANQTGSCWPSIKHIAEEIGVSIPTVNRAIKSLDENGFISRQKRARRNNLYTIPDPEIHPESTTQSPFPKPQNNPDDISPVIRDDISPVIHYKEKSDKEKTNRVDSQAVKDDLSLDPFQVRRQPYPNEGALTGTEWGDKPVEFEEFLESMKEDDPEFIRDFKEERKFIRRFVDLYPQYRHSKHPRLKPRQWYHAALRIQDVCVGPEYPDRTLLGFCSYDSPIDAYHRQNYNPKNGVCNYSILHLASMGSRAHFLNRVYD